MLGVGELRIVAREARSQADPPGLPRTPTSQDVCAGTIIVTEAGGRVVPSQPPACLLTASGEVGEGEVPDADLGSRLYLAIRPCTSAEGETASQAQERLIREVWRRCEKLDYVRPQ